MAAATCTGHLLLWFGKRSILLSLLVSETLVLWFILSKSIDQLAFPTTNTYSKTKKYKYTTIKTNYPCLIDLIYKDERCSKQQNATICTFPNVIIKQITIQGYDYDTTNAAINTEIHDMYLSYVDKRYVPQLYQYDDRCRTLVIENVDKNFTSSTDNNRTRTNKTSSSCLIDLLYTTESCMERSEGTICVFPRVIIKQVSKRKNYAREINMHYELSDTRYFPQLYDFGMEEQQQECRTLFIENVQAPNDHQKHTNVWSSNYTYYANFIDKAFSIFEEKHIIPFDLNWCCNMVVNGTEMHIIDFGAYQIESKNDTERYIESEIIKLKLLQRVMNETKRYQNKLLEEEESYQRIMDRVGLFLFKLFTPSSQPISPGMQGTTSVSNTSLPSIDDDVE